MPNHIANLAGQKRHHLTALKIVGTNAYGRMLWECRCDCGNLKVLSVEHFGETKSCGCLKFPNLLGVKQGFLTVIERLDAPKEKQNHGPAGQRWLCRCDCGNTIICFTGQINSGRIKSCGICPRRGSVNRKDLIGTVAGMLTVKKLTRRIDGRWMCLCQCNCGNVVEVRVSQISSKSIKSCGCLSRRRGEDNPSWKPYAKSYRRNRKCRPEYKQWREEVFKRDNYTCQVCGGRSASGRKIILNAHHKNSWAICQSQRLDVNNGATSCNKCHRAFHKKYGFNTTAEQWAEFKIDFNLA